MRIRSQRDRGGASGATSDQLLEYIAPYCKELRTLNLRGCVQVTDVGAVGFAAHCQQLRELVLAACDLVTDATVLAYAAGCTRLQVVDMDFCPLVTAASVAELRRKSGI